MSLTITEYYITKSSRRHPQRYLAARNGPQNEPTENGTETTIDKITNIGNNKNNDDDDDDERYDNDDDDDDERCDDDGDASLV